MARYLDEQQAAADGFSIVHEPDRHRYAIYERRRSGVEGVDGGSGEGAREPAAAGPGDRVVGEAHYSLIGEEAIDFDHTVVLPELRGTGLAGLLAHRAVTGEAVGERRVLASCWFIAGYLEKHPIGSRDHTSPSA